MDQPALHATGTEMTRGATITFGPRVRKSPYFEATQRWGCNAYSIYNQMYLSLYYEDPVTDYRHLVETVTLWDVEVTGRDAAAFTQLLTTRNLDHCAVGQCKYVPIVDVDHNTIGDELRVATPRGEVGATICPLPFIEPPAELRAKTLHICAAAA